MVNYNPKDWSFFIFKMHKADTVRKLLPMLIYMAAYSFVVILLLKMYLPEDLVNFDKNLTIMHSLLGFVISMLLVFRTNTAYDRWWEGRKVWGSLINTSRNLFIKFHYLSQSEEATQKLNQKVVAFADLLKQHLRAKKGNSGLKQDHLPFEKTAELYQTICIMQQQKVINDTQFLVINNDLQLLMDYTGMCERIRNTPIPFIYSMFIKKFIFFYVMTLPFAFAFNISYAGIPVTVFIFYVLASLETIAEEIEDPFGTDANDLPLENYIQVIESSSKELFSTYKP
jgi:ion channel-forming bestrophin family protein